MKSISYTQLAWRIITVVIAGNGFSTEQAKSSKQQQRTALYYEDDFRDAARLLIARQGWHFIYADDYRKHVEHVAEQLKNAQAELPVCKKICCNRN